MISHWATSPEAGTAVPAGGAEPAGTGTVHLWLIRSDLPPAVLAGLEEILDAQQRRRLEALTFPDHRGRFVAAHSAVRLILARHLGIGPDQIGWVRGPNGKPELAGALTPARSGLHVSLSHSDGLALLAVTRARRVGVDIQRLPHRFDATRMATRYFPRDEAQYVVAAGGPGAQTRRFFRLWTRKEACVKVVGGRLMQGMALPVRAAGQPDRAGIVIHHPANPIPGPYRVRDLAVPPGFRAAVAAEGGQDYRLIHHRWRPPLMAAPPRREVHRRIA